MAIINPEEWQKIKEQIDYGLEHYGDNVAELIKIYKSIKTVLTDHGFNPSDKLTGTGVKQYPLIISQSFLDLETKIQELQGTIIQRDNTIAQYEGNFSDIADAIISRGVNVSEDDPYDIYPSKILAIGTGQTVFNGLGAFNEYGYLSGDVKIPEGVTILGQGVVYYGNYLKTLTLPKTLESFDDYALCRGDANFPVNLQEIIFPINCTKIGVKACRQIGTALSKPVSITFLSSKNSFTLSTQCFFESALGEVIFESSNTSGTEIRIGEQALYGTKPLKIQFPINTQLYLQAKVFTPNVDLQMNLENVTSIATKANSSFQGCRLIDEQANMIISKLTQDSTTQQTFLDCGSLSNIYFDYWKLGASMFYNCGLSQITFSNKINIIMTSAIDTNNTDVLFDNLDSYKDNSIEYYSMCYDGNTINPATINFRLNKHYTTYTNITGKPTARAVLRKDYGKYNSYIYAWKYSNLLTTNYNNSSYEAEGYCQRGYGLWTKTMSYPTNDEVYKFLTKINQKTSGMFGILNGLKGISDLRLPYSSNQFWGGTDPTGVLTADYKTITFDTCGWDPTISGYSTGPHLFIVGGFNNLKKLIWKKTEPNSIIRSHTLGLPQNKDNPNDYSTSWKILQQLEEVYFGDGATILESYIFACIFPGLYSYSNYYQYVYTYNANWSICLFDYPMLKTIYLPGSIKATRDDCLVIKGGDNFYLHPLYCGIGNTDYFQNLDQILLGPGWSLSIELTSLCFRDKDNNPYYNLVLAPEAMIFNINNLKNCSSESSPKQLIVTNKTLYDLRIYCNQYQGQEKIILKGTQCEPAEPIIISSYNNLIKLANDKNWEIISVAHSTWTSNLTDNADNLIIDANTNSITT